MPTPVTRNPAITISDFPPNAPLVGDLWWSTTTGQQNVWYDDGTTVQWVISNRGMCGSPGEQGPPGPPGTASVVVGPTPPDPPETNQLWWSDELGQLFVWYNDGTTSQWVAASTAPQLPDLSAYAPLNSPTFTGTPTAPTPPLGDADTSIATTAFVQRAFAEVIYTGAGDYTVDVPAIQALLDSGPPELVTIVLRGDIELGWGPVGSTPTPDYYRWNYPRAPVYNAIQLVRSNVKIDGTHATIRFAPVPYLGTPGKYTNKPKWAAFGTQQNIQPRTLDNIEIFGCSFDYTGAAEGLTTAAQPFCIVGCSNVRIHDCKYFNVPIAGVVTLGDDGSGNVLVTWPAHGFQTRTVVSFSAPVPPTVTPGYEYYVRDLTTDTFKLSQVDNGSLLAMSGPEITNIPAQAVPTLGFGLELDNLDDSAFWDNDFRYMQQAYFINYCRNTHWRGDNFVQINEAMDFQTCCQKGSIVNCTFSAGWNEAQSIDGSGLQDFLISSNVFDRVRTPIQVYAKSIPQKFSDFAAGTVFYASFPSAGTPGVVVTEPECVPYVGMRIWFEYATVTTETFPGETAPGAGNGNIQKCTTYIVTSVTGDTFRVQKESKDGSGNTIIPPVPDGVQIDFTTAGSPDCIMHILPDTPLDFVQCRNVVVSNNIGTNLITTLQDVDPENPQPIIPVGSRVVMIGQERKITPGTERGQYVNGMPYLCSNIQILGNSFQGGRNFEVWECERLLIDDLLLQDLNPGLTGTAPTRDTQPAMLVQSSYANTPGFQQSTLSGAMRNVRIVNTQGRALLLVAPAAFTLENFTVDGYNQGSLDGRGGTIINFSRMNWRAGKKRFGPIALRNGTASVSVSTHLSMRNTAAPPAVVASEVVFRGPIFLPTLTNFYPLLCDYGPYIYERETLVVGKSLANTTVAGVKIPAIPPVKLNQHLMAASIFIGEAITVFNATNYTSVRLMKLSAAGVSTSITSLMPIDNVARAVNEEIVFTVNAAGNNTNVELAPGDMVQLEFFRNGTGSSIPWLSLAYNVLPFSTVV